MKKLYNYLAFLFLILSFASCSLLKVSIESENEPLEKEQLINRSLIQNVAPFYFHEIISASDSIFNSTKNRQTQEHALLWKITAVRNAKNKIFQDDPKIAILDTWVFTNTMNDYLTKGPGKELFEKYQPIAINTCNTLSNKIDTIAQKAFKEDYSIAKRFVDSIRENTPLTNNDLYKESIFEKWQAYRNIPDSLAYIPPGTLAQVLANSTNKIATDTEQSIAILGWETELLIKKNKLDSIDLQILSENFNQRAKEIIETINRSSDNLKEDARMLHNDFNHFLDELNIHVDTLTDFASREMVLIRKTVDDERREIMKSIDETGVKITDQVMTELRVIINDVLIYYIIFLIVILVVPFALGFLAGRQFPKRKKNDNE